MQHASGKDYDPSAWAKERQERIKRALQARQQRQSGSPDKNHTFKPQLLGGTTGISSKLPAGARVGDASATRGSYDLTVLEGMDGAFPPKRTSSNIYRDNRYDSGASNDSGGGGVRNKGPMDMGGTSDSLDRLAVSTTERRRVSRSGSTSSHNMASPRPLPAKSAPYHDGNRYPSDVRETRQHEARGIEDEETTAREVRGQQRERLRDDPGGRWTGPTREAKNGSWNGPHDDDDDRNKDDGDSNSNRAAEIGGRGGDFVRRRSSPSAVAATTRTTTTTRDALSQEVEQRPQVRGSISEEQHHHHQRHADYDGDQRDHQRWVGCRGANTGGALGGGAVDERESRAKGRGGQRVEGDASDDASLSEGRRRNEEAAARTADGDFFASLRGSDGQDDAGEVTTGATRRGGGGGGPVIAGSSQTGRMRHARRPEWNSDTAAVASLGGEGAQASMLTDNSPAAVQARVEMPTRRRSRNDVIAESPYAAGGGAFGSTKTNGPTKTANNNNNNSHSANNNDSSWKHKHTKTLPWNNGEAIEPTGGVSAGEIDSSIGAGDAARERGTFGGRPSALNQSARENDVGGSGAGGAGREREGYRKQMMPSPSTGKLTAAVAAAATAMYRGHGNADYRDGGGGAGGGGNGGGVPAEKEQLRRNLSLLKKKMHGQGGSRRSQSAGPRAGDLFADPNYLSQGGPGENDGAGGRQHLHMTTGTAPANPGAFLRDRDTTAGRREQLGRRGSGVDARGRPPPEGPGSPYAIDPTSREAAAEASTRTGTRSYQDKHHTNQPQHLQRQQQQQQQAHADGRNGRKYNGGFSLAPNSGSGSGSSSSNSVHDATSASAGRRGYGQRSQRDTDGGRHGSLAASVSDRTAAAARRSHGRTGGVIETVSGEGIPERAPRRAVADAPKARSRGSQGKKSPLSPDRRRAWEGDVVVGGRGDGSRSKGGGVGRSVGARDGGIGGGGGGGYADELPPDAFPDRQVELQQCETCTRRFTKEALEKHSRACWKVFQAKRKVFNAAEMRIKGTELEKFAKTKGRLGAGGSRNGGRGAGGHRGGKAATARGFDDTPVGGGGGGGAKSSKWRQQSKQFRDALRQARVVTDAQKGGKSLADLPPPKPSAPDPSLIPCPHCGRRFSELAGERHIQHCKNIKAKPSALKKGSGSLLGHASRKTSSGASGGGKARRW